MKPNEPPPVALTIAGSDSGGGAGIQADLKTFHQWRVFGASAVTAVTAQNTLGVQAVQALPTELVRAQIQSVTADFSVAAVKSGMLANREIVQTVAEALREHMLTRYVLDPVMVATSGDRLLAPEAVESIRDELVPLAALVTPNWPEARLLTGVRRNSVAGMEEAARALVEAGAGAALIKGGHLPGDEVVDLYLDARRRRILRGPRIATRHTHGTGCTLSAAIAAAMAAGVRREEAVVEAVAWVRAAIATAPGLGAGCGPLDHFAGLRGRVRGGGSREIIASSSRPSDAPASSP